jgi:glycosyltransferase involved in cell wall biosynthesis
LSAYKNDEKPGKYVFFTSTLWKKEPVSNNLRRNFIKACKQTDEIKFEGGFTPRKRKEIKGFEEDTVDRLYPLKEYLEKIKKSVVVFNTPVVLNCHGWKLAEFMAMKKAIISTKISNQLPEPLEEGRNIVGTTGEIADIKNAVLKVIGNLEYQESLQNNAFEYYTKYLSPIAVVTKIVTDKYPHQNMSAHE